MSIVFCLSVSSCSHKKALTDFNSKTWKDDPFGCKNERLVFIPDLLKEKDNLLNMSDSEILDIFGTPDITDFGKKSKKSFFYFIEPAAKCNGAKKNGRKLAIDFGSLNNVTFVTVQKW